MKKETKNYLKFGILLIGISLLLWSCEKSEIFDETYSVPSIDIAKSHLNNNLKSKSNNPKFPSKILWEKSIITEFKQGINILYTPIELNNKNYKSFLASIKKNNIVENQIITLIYDTDVNSSLFNGKLLIHNSTGEMIKYYEYFNDRKQYVYFMKKNKHKNKNSDECFVPDFDDILWLISQGSPIILPDCAVIDGNNSNDLEEDNDGSGDEVDWDIPDDNLNNNGTSGSSGNPISCPTGKAYNVQSGKCECIGLDKVENNNGICVKKCETTLADVQKVFPNTNSALLQKIVDYINKHGKDFGIDSDEKMQHFLSQAGHEATNPVNGIPFDTFEENLNYRWTKLGTTDYWDKYFNPITNPTANPNKANPNNFKRSATSNFVDIQKFANYVYDDARRGKSKLGNTNVGDGYKYRGRGIFQLTGKYNYQQFTSFYQNKYQSSLDFINNPNLVSSNTEIAVISALWFFKTKVGNVTSNTSVAQVTSKINPALKGIKHRKSLYNNTKNHINCK